MADYGIGNRYLDHDGGYADMAAPAAKRPARVQKKVVKTSTFDFGGGQYTVQDFRDFVDQTMDLPANARVTVQYYNSQMDGTTFKVTVTE